MHDTPPPAGSPSTPGPDRAHRIAIIAAVARNGVIGIGNRLPWQLPEDMRRFRSLTTGHTVIMGRRTWESIGKPLPGRQNLVVSRSSGPATPEVEFIESFDSALSRVSRPDPVFVIGGEALYQVALPRAELLYLTEIERDFDGDARFPAFDRSRWRESAREAHVASDPVDPLAYCFVDYARADR